jgi:hypothetical protein
MTLIFIPNGTAQPQGLYFWEHLSNKENLCSTCILDAVFQVNSVLNTELGTF